jgi:hypothetical protein
MEIVEIRPKPGYSSSLKALRKAVLRMMFDETSGKWSRICGTREGE